MASSLTLGLERSSLQEPLLTCLCLGLEVTSGWQTFSFVLKINKTMGKKVVILPIFRGKDKMMEGRDGLSDSVHPEQAASGGVF